MADLDPTIESLRALPKGEQDALAAQIDLILDAGDESLLTDEQWVEIEARLDANESFTPHTEVVKAFRDRTR
jgi:hypothetical protein